LTRRGLSNQILFVPLITRKKIHTVLDRQIINTASPRRNYVGHEIKTNTLTSNMAYHLKHASSPTFATLLGARSMCAIIRHISKCLCG